MADLVHRLASSGSTENAGFLNELIKQLWPNINVGVSAMIKEIVEPMLASMLPGPLSGLKFVKLDLGDVPIQVSKVGVQRVDNGVKLDMDVAWHGDSDIELDGKMVPKIGIERIHLNGRLSILLAPLTNVIPLIGAAQIAFINPPRLKLDFTDAAEVADWDILDKTVRKIILDIIGSMAVLPNRFLYKLDANNDFFKTYLSYQGVLRLTVQKAVGVKGPKNESGVKALLHKVVKDVPDCYCIVNIGAEEEWRTSVKNNSLNPEWNETHDFLVSDFDQQIHFDVHDDDYGGHDELGVAATTVKDIVLKGGSQELALTCQGEPTGATLSLSSKFYKLVDDAGAVASAENESKGQIVGLATVLIASALGLEGERDQLNPSVKVTWGGKEFQTAVVTYAPGVDVFNPAFDQGFRFPVTADLLADAGTFKIALLNKTQESGFVEIRFEDVLQSPGLVKEDSFDVGSGAKVRASISLRGLQLSS